jgi:hypothetical protein
VPSAGRDRGSAIPTTYVAPRAQLRSLLAELDLLMAIDGLPTVADLLAAGVRRL